MGTTRYRINIIELDVCQHLYCSSNSFHILANASSMKHYPTYSSGDFTIIFSFQFLLLMMGMKGATSHFACIWCKIHKHSRLVRKVIVYNTNVRNLIRYYKQKMSIMLQDITCFCLCGEYLFSNYVTDILKYT